jgi:hypothetical protein
VLTSFQLSDPFGLHTRFVWFDNFIALFKDPLYLKSIVTTLLFSGSVALVSICCGLFLASMANRLLRFTTLTRTLLIWPYAVAPAIHEIWGPLASEVALQFAAKREVLKEFEFLLPQQWERLHPLFQKVQPPTYFADLFARTGAPFTLKAFNLSPAEFRLAALNARAIRGRLTVLDLAAHFGVLEAATEDALKLLS